MAKQEHGTELESRTERLSQLESLPAEILENVFICSQSLALLAVSRRIRDILNREYLLEKVMMATFYDVGWFACSDTGPCWPLSDRFDFTAEAVPRWKTAMTHPAFKFSWFDQHLRRWMIRTAKNLVKGWSKRVKSDDVSQSLPMVNARLDESLAAKIVDKPASEGFSDFGIGMYRDKVWLSKHEFGQDVDEDTLETMRNDGCELLLMVFEAGGVQTPQPGVVDVMSDDDHTMCIPPFRAIYMSPWARVPHMVPKGYCRAPFTQNKGNMLKCVLDFCNGMDEYALREVSQFPILSDFGDGLEEALSAGCLPAIFCLGNQCYAPKSDFCNLDLSWQPNWAKDIFSSEPLVLDSYKNLNVPDPWLYLNGNCGLRFNGEDFEISGQLRYPRPRVEERHLLACLNNLNAAPILYTFFLNSLLADFFTIFSYEPVTLSSAFLNALYVCTQGQSGQVKAALNSIYKRCNEKCEYRSRPIEK